MLNRHASQDKKSHCQQHNPMRDREQEQKDQLCAVKPSTIRSVAVYPHHAEQDRTQGMPSAAQGNEYSEILGYHGCHPGREETAADEGILVKLQRDRDPSDDAEDSLSWER